MEGAEGSRPSPSPEARRTPEKRYTREEVIGAVHSAQELLNTNINESSLPVDQWLKESVNSAVEKTVDHPDGPRETFTNQFDDADTGEVNRYSQEEGIPVDGVLNYLRIKIQDLGRSNPAERKRLMDIGNTLYRSSRSYSELHDMTGPQYLNRARQEANLISADDRRNISDGTKEGDFFAAEDALGGNESVKKYRGRSEKAWLTRPDQVLNGRRELVLPAEVAPEEPAEEVAVAPAGAAAEPEEPEAAPVVEAEPAPVTTINEIRARTLTIGNRTEGMRKRAAEMSEKHLRAEQRRGSAWNPLNWPRKIGLRVAEGYFRQQFIDRHTKAAIEHSNSYLDTELFTKAAFDATKNVDDERAAGKAAIDQINSGELRPGMEVKPLLDKKSPLYTDLMKDVVRPMVEGGLNPGQIQQKLRDIVEKHQKDPQVEAIFGRDATQYGRLAEYFATDLTEVADAIRQDATIQKDLLENLDKHINIQFANYRWAANTEANFNNADKFIAWAEKKRLTGWLINPATVGAAASLAAFGGTRLLGLAGTAAQTYIPFVGALAGGVFAGLRRNMDLKRDMASHQVERAYGEEITDPKEQKRRQALENFKYDTASTTDLLKGITDASKDLGTESNRQQLANKIAEIQVRLDFSVDKKVDLVTFESATKVEQGRMGLIKAMVEAKKALQDQGGLSKDEVNGLVNKEVDPWKKRFMDNKDDQDRDFKNYRMRQALKAGVFGGVAGLAGSLVSQQAFAEIGRHLPGAKEIPVLGSLFKTGDTVGEKLVQGVSKAVETGDAREALVNPFGTTRAEGFAKDISENLYKNPGTGVDIAPGVKMFSDASHNVSFQDAAGNIISTPGIELSADGHLIQKGSPDQLPANLRDIFNKPGWETQVHADAGFNINKARDLLITPGSRDLGNGITLQVGVDRIARLVDPLGQTISTPAMSLTPDGHLSVAGGYDQLPTDVRALLDPEWKHDTTTTANFNLREEVTKVIGSGKPETLQHGNAIIDVDPIRKTFSILTGNPDDPTRIPGHQLHGTIRPDGSLAFDPKMTGNERLIWAEVQKELGAESWSSQRFEIPGETIPGVDKVQNKTVEVNINEWLKDHGEQAKRDIWHDNSTPMHMENGKLVGADGKELQFHHRVQPDGSVILDMKDMYSRMTPKGGVNWDNTIDNTYNRLMNDIIKNPDGTNSFKNMQLLITPNDAADQARQVIALNIPADGQLTVPKDLAPILFKHNPDGSLVLDPKNFNNPVQAVRFLEIAHGDLGPDGNLIRRDVISTTVGANFDGSMKVTVPEVIPGEPKITPPRDGFILTPPSSEPTITTDLTPPADKTFTEFIPADATQLEQAPMIPIPMVPRYPLEPLEERIKTDYIYGGRMTKEKKALFEKMRSETLKKNPGATLDPYAESKAYFDRQEPGYTADVAKLAEQITAPPSPKLKAIVAIPVAGHQEGKSIYNSLFNYTQQDLPKDQYEILLFVNRPQVDREGKPIVPDNTMDEIQRFMTDHPDMPIRIVNKVMSPDEANIGTVRKNLNDIALYRNMQRGEKAGDVIIVSNDADNKGIAPTYLSNFVDKFDKDKKADCMLGQLDWDPESYVKYPLVHVGTRLFQYLNAIGRHKSGRMVSSGANSAFKASIYAGIGGYLSEIEGGEDVAIGQAIIEARGQHDRIKFAGPRVSRLYTSSRRAIDAMKSGLVPAIQWNKGFSAFDDEVRNLELGEGNEVDYDNPATVQKLKSDMEVVVNKTLDVYEEGEPLGKDHPYYQKAMRYLGIQYEVKDGQVAITNMDSMVGRLRQYQKMGVLLRNIKSGKGTPEMQRELADLQNSYQAELRRISGEKTVAELAQEEDSASQKYEQFAAAEPINFPIPEAKYSKDDLETSTETLEIGNYVVCNDKPLGSGGMGNIVAGYDKTTGQVFAFKRVPREDQEHIARVNQYPDGVVDIEDIIKAETDNPALGVYQDKIDQDGELIKIYNVEGPDLDRVLTDKGKLPADQALGVVIQTLQAVRDLHKIGIVHLDLSPTNILTTPNGIRLIDFNAASIQNGPRNSYSRGFVGGFSYMLPPELFKENPIITENSDTYEAAILLYKTITGSYPYNPSSRDPGTKTEQLEKKHAEGKFDIPNNIPDSIKAILTKGISPDPRKRYQTAAEMLNDLLDAYSQIKPPTAPGTP